MLQSLARSPASADQLDAFAGDRSFVMSFARGVSVIQAFANVSRPLTIAEVSHRVQIPRAAVRRLLHTLAELGFVRSVGLRYELTPKVLQLGNAFSSSNDIALGVQPIVNRTAARLGSFCALLVPDGDHTMLMCMAGSSTDNDARLVKPCPGGRAPLYASASGLLFLGDMPDAALDAYFARVAVLPLTVRTPTVPAQIRQAARRARAQGYAACDRTFSNLLRSVAVPVADAKGHVVAAVTAVVGAEKLTEHALRHTLLPTLREAAAEAARRWRRTPAALQEAG